jgi:NADH:ubiquinone oxidoreductase subunit F (NADH-binding)
MPRPRPPFPAIAGLWGKPTIINNVETLASVARIFQNDATWFSKYGTEKSRGTKTFALVGKVKNSGLISEEVLLIIKNLRQFRPVAHQEDASLLTFLIYPSSMNPCARLEQ